MGFKFRRKVLSLMLTVLFLVTLVFPVGTFAETATSETFTIALLGTSDLHGQVMGWNYFTKSPASGLTRVATLINQERSKYPNNILVDAGDTIQGTPLVYYYNKVDTSWISAPDKGYPMIDAFKYLKYDAWTLGNHEFNFGLGVLEPIIDEATSANINVLSANTLDAGTEATWGKVKPYSIKSFQAPDGSSLKVGILGLTTPAIPNWESQQNYPGLEFGDVVTEGKKWVQHLKNVEQVDAIVAVIHSGLGDQDPSDDSTKFENEVLAFANANPEVNAIMSGHTHTNIYQRIGVNNIWTLQPKNAGAGLAELAMNFAKNSEGKWVMQTADGSVINVTNSIPEDSGLVAAAQPYHQAALNYLQTPIGTATGNFLANGQTVKDTALMDLVNEVQMYYGDADLSVAAPFSASAKIPQGTVTIGDVSSVYIYENFLFTVKVTGEQLRKYLEFSSGRYYLKYNNGDSKIITNGGPNGSGGTLVPDYNLDILQGAEYTIDLTKTGLWDAYGKPVVNGEPRITKLKIHGQDVKDTDEFKLALNNYRVNGGGAFLAAAGITPQADDPNAPNYITYDSQKTLGDDGQVRSLMIKYFQDMAQGKVKPGKTAVEPVYDNNWQTTPRFFDFVEFTDTHGNIDNYPTSGTVKASAALLAGAVNKERATYGDERTVVLSAGDMMQGTPISNVLKGKPVIDVMNQMKFDAMEIGNHEFDWGAATLNQNLTNAKFPMLAANLQLRDGDTDADSAQLITNLKPYTIVEKDGVKVGVIGVINPETANIVMPAIIQHFEIVDPVAKVNQYVPLVKAAGADIIVVLAHIGDQYNYWPTSGDQPVTEPLSQDLANLAKGISGVDAVFGGHSHTTNYDMVTDATGKRIPAIIGYANGRGAGVIRLALDENDQVMGAAPGYLDVGNRLYKSLTPDAAVQAIVDAANAQIGPIFSEVIGRAEVDMTRATASSGNLDSNLGDWAADVTKAAGKADFGFQNSGGLRIDLPKGDITVGQIWTLMPFDNEINVMDMTGAQVKNVLEYLISGIKTPGHISGLRFTYDPNSPARFSLVNNKVVEYPANSRIQTITLPDGTPLDLNKVYKVAAPDFIATGGDNYPFPANSANLTNPHILVRDALIDDVRARKVLSYQPDGRIQVYVAPVITNTLGSSIIALADRDFNISLVANSRLNSAVRLRITLEDPEQRSDIKLKYLANGEYSQLEFDKAGQAWFGMQSGFPLADATYPFKVRFTKEGTFAFTLDLIQVDTGLVLASKTESIDVSSKIHNAAK